MRSAIEVANWMILNRGNIELSNLKVQKLLYIAFGCHFADFDEHLFYDPIEAWRYGPVVQSIYHCLKFNGPSAIKTGIVHPDGSVPIVGDEERNAIVTLKAVLGSFGQMSASQLVHWTHTQNGPWDLTYDDRRAGFQEISKQLIRHHFIESQDRRIPRARLRSVRARGADSASWASFGPNEGPGGAGQSSRESAVSGQSLALSRRGPNEGDAGASNRGHAETVRHVALTIVKD